MIGHALKMVGRNARSYLLLSVTVTLSFALLLGYLGFTDSDLYNRYKELFASDRSLVHVWSETVGDSKFTLLEEKTAALANTAHYEEFILYPDPSERKYVSEEQEVFTLPAVRINCLPAHCWDIYNDDTRLDVRWLDGSTHDGVSLRSGEAIMEEHFYRLLGLEDRKDLWQMAVLAPGRGSTAYCGEFKVVGVYFDPSVGELDAARLNDRGLNWMMAVYLSQKDISPAILKGQNWIEKAHYYSASPETVYELARSINFAEYGGGIGDPIAAQQRRALEVKQSENRTKALIASALLVLLGINLYSAFSNALNDRKFEIGVKRAVGASAFSVVRQFFYESMLLMCANISCAVWLVCGVFLVYKSIYERTPDKWGVFHDWIIYLSPYSICMFAACAAALTIGFSLIFSYSSTQVEVVKYLKEE